jgi:uncharacterized protein
MGRVLAAFALLLALVAQASPVAALDCAKASEPIEKMLCSSAELKKADDEMSAAYFKVLHDAKDPEVHAAVIQSQQRWLRERVLGLQRLAAVAGDGTYERVVLLDWTRDRLVALGATMMWAIEPRWKMAAAPGDGPFNGSRTTCSFLAPPYANWDYVCWGAVYRQHHDRICVVEKGKPPAVAGCGLGYVSADAKCPAPGRSVRSAYEDTKPGLRPHDSPLPDPREISKYDLESGLETDDELWMEQCFSPVFPAQPLPAAAPDCARLTQPIAKMLCASASLRKLDDEMTAAYLKLLGETTDPDFHAALIASQLRWLKARLAGPQRVGLADGDKTDDRELLHRWTAGRLYFLTHGQPIKAMEEQRRIAARDSGGRFAGYATTCGFSPQPDGGGDWPYSCATAVYRQHHDWVCSVTTMRAGIHTTDIRVLTTVANENRPRPLASCWIGYAATDALCPDRNQSAEDKARARWKRDPGEATDLVMVRLPGNTGALWKYDPDLTPAQYEQPWMDDCLFAPVFPPPEQSRPNATP